MTLIPPQSKKEAKKGHRPSLVPNPEKPRNPVPRAGLTPLEGEPSNQKPNLREKRFPMKSEKKVMLNES